MIERMNHFILGWPHGIEPRAELGLSCNDPIGLSMRLLLSSAGLPTAYLAEGLLYYLSSDAVRHLLSTLASISAPGISLCEPLDNWNRADWSCINQQLDFCRSLPQCLRGCRYRYQLKLKSTVAWVPGYTVACVCVCNSITIHLSPSPCLQEVP